MAAGVLQQKISFDFEQLSTSTFLERNLIIGHRPDATEQESDYHR